jgi:polyferredoxin
VVSLFGSRLFCGWLCPGGALQDQVANSNSRTWNSKWKNASKYIIWIVWLSFIIFLWIRHFPLKINFFYMSGINLFIVIIYFVVTTIIYVFSLLTGKRGMCHSICWMAPFMVIGEKIADFLHIPRFRLKADSNTCVSCKQCNRNCPMGLDVVEMVKSGKMDSTECISCLECVDGCSKKVITCGIQR